MSVMVVNDSTVNFTSREERGQQWRHTDLDLVAGVILQTGIVISHPHLGGSPPQFPQLVVALFTQPPASVVISSSSDVIAPPSLLLLLLMVVCDTMCDVIAML